MTIYLLQYLQNYTLKQIGQKSTDSHNGCQHLHKFNYYQIIDDKTYKALKKCISRRQNKLYANSRITDYCFILRYLALTFVGVSPKYFLQYSPRWLDDEKPYFLEI